VDEDSEMKYLVQSSPPVTRGNSADTIGLETLDMRVDT
jgi:hypothetical protein